MSIIYIDEWPRCSFFEQLLSNGTYRYEGYKNSIRYCIDSKVKKTIQEINDFIDSKSVDYFIAREGYIIDLV